MTKNKTSQFSSDILYHCLQHHVIPLLQEEKTLTIAAENDNKERDNQLQFALNCTINTVIWSLENIVNAKQELKNYNPHLQLINHQQLPTIEFVNQVLLISIQQRASDIHFEPYQYHYRIRYRTDGVLHYLVSPSTSEAKQIVARLKIIANLNIAEYRLPQDGQFQFEYQELKQALRISTVPVTFGEKVVLRIMESANQQVDIKQLGLSQNNLRDYLNTLANPQGLILVTGPTGSGKTMTLYSGLAYLNQVSRNICSVEDPVEISLEGINQTQVNHKIGLSFSQTLRAFLRQDPDVIMVGEIRDQETAEIAIQAAQTGHLVLSTLHTNSSIEALTRLNQMGIANYLLASSINLVIAQRLIRKLCEHCKEPAKKMIRPMLYEKPIKHWLAIGCQRCLGGYYQRTGIYELLIITPEIQQQLVKSPTITTREIQEIAEQQNMTNLYHSGIKLVEQGTTSYAELTRVLDNILLQNHSKNKLKDDENSE